MRRPEPWYRASKGAWYVQFGDKQVRLAKGPKDETEEAAFDAYYKLMAQQPENMPKGEELLLALVCDLFLEHSKSNHEPATYTLYQHFLQSFCKLYGRTAAQDLKPFHVTRWLDQHPKWKASRRQAFDAGLLTLDEIRQQVAGWLGHAAQADSLQLFARLSRRWPFTEFTNNS